MPRLFLIRHGEPELKGTLLGRRDPGLSAEGRIAAGAAMAGIDAAVAYVSPLRRARETAAFLPPGIRRIITGGLIEIGLGEWEGLEWREVEARWPDVARRKLERWFDVPAPGGETWPRVAARRAGDRADSRGSVSGRRRGASRHQFRDHRAVDRKRPADVRARLLRDSHL